MAVEWIDVAEARQRDGLRLALVTRRAEPVGRGGEGASST